MPGHAFVDESKERGYLVTVAMLEPADLPTARKTIKGLIMPGQHRLHFAKEGSRRRRLILSAFEGLPCDIVIYDASAHPRRQQRESCLLSLVDDLAKSDARMLILERDDSVLDLDNRLLYRRIRMNDCADKLTYTHRRAREEPLLAIPDAIAWCWARGGEWRMRARPLVQDVRRTNVVGP